MSDPPLLQITGVTVTRDGRPAVERATIDIPRGSIHALVGPNGAGKSSLIAAVLGDAPFTGTIRCHFRATGRIGVVPQTFPVDPTLPLTVGEMLALPRQRLPVCLGLTAAARARIAPLLDRVGLPGFERRRLGALSGGELRRVLLADAIDPDPELLVLDEPAAGLDEPSNARLEATLRDLRDTRGATILLVTHDAAQVRRLADAVTWIDRTVRRSGAPADILGHRGPFPFTEGDLPA